MSLESAYKNFEQAITQALDWFKGEIAGLRTGRIKTNLVESIPVEHYGARTPLQGLASTALSDARTIVVSPWDPSAIPAIEKALVAAQLGVQPIVDGKVLRLSFPMLSEEMREQTIKQLNKIAEGARVRLRKGRDEALTMIRQDKQAGDITEDDFYDGKKKLDNMIDHANQELETLITKKEEEIRTI